MRRPPALALLLATAGALAAAGCGGTTTVVTVTGAEPTTGAAPGATATTTEPSTPAGSTDTRTTLTALPHTPTDSGTATRTTITSAAPDEGVLVQRPAGFPNGGEAYLLARLDPEIARRCTREGADSLSRGAVAGLYCDTSGTLGATAYYDLFPSRARMEAAYGRFRRANDVPLASGDCVPGTGRRPSSIPAEGAWSRASLRGEGRVMCFRSKGKVWLLTSQGSVRTLSFFSADRRAPVTAFWHGPGLPTRNPR